MTISKYHLLRLVSEGIKRIGASRFSLINASGPVMTIGFAFVFLSETMTIQQIIGAVVIIGILCVSEQRKINLRKKEFHGVPEREK